MAMFRTRGPSISSFPSRILEGEILWVARLLPAQEFRGPSSSAFVNPLPDMEAVRRRRRMFQLLSLALYYLVGIWFTSPTVAHMSLDNVIDGMYFSTLTLSTVGYGDVVPADDDFTRVLACAWILFGAGNKLDSPQFCCRVRPIRKNSTAIVVGERHRIYLTAYRIIVYYDLI